MRKEQGFFNEVLGVLLRSSAETLTKLSLRGANLTASNLDFLKLELAQNMSTSTRLEEFELADNEYPPVVGEEHLRLVSPVSGGSSELRSSLEEFFKALRNLGIF